MEERLQLTDSPGTIFPSRSVIGFTITVGFLMYVSGMGSQPVPRIVLQQAIDLGKIDPLEGIRDYSIPVQNDGKKPLTVSFVSSSCGCIRIRKIDQPLAPGRTGVIHLMVDPSEASPGTKKQVLLFKTNDPDREQATVEVYYRLKLPDVAVSPDAIKVELSDNEVKSSAANTRNSIVVVDTWVKQLAISKIETSPHLITSFYDITYRCPQGIETHMCRFDTRLLPDLPAGAFREWLKFATNHPDYPSVTVVISGTVLDGVKITPHMVLFRDVAPAGPMEKTVHIEAPGDKSVLRIKEATSADEWLTVTYAAVDARKTDLCVRLDPAYIASAKKEGVALFKSVIRVQIDEPSMMQKNVNVVVVMNNVE